MDWKPSRWAWLVAGGIVAGSAFFTWLDRAESNRAWLRRIQRTPPPAGAHLYDGLELVHFYATPGEIRQGEKSIMCYGVRNAKAVRLTPAVYEVKPSFNRCFDVRPTQDTEYTFEAEDAAGKVVRAHLRITVKPPLPEILLWATSETNLRRGEKFTLCYGFKNVLKARLEPTGMNLPPSPKNCVMWYPAASMDLKLVAEGQAGEQITQKTRITVH